MIDPVKTVRDGCDYPTGTEALLHDLADEVERLRANADSLWEDVKCADEANRQLVADNERLRAERQAYADELYELRNRAGCGPEQAGLDIWQQNAELLAALKPFSDAVYNDNGDVTITHCEIDDYVKAYFVVRRITKAESKHETAGS